MTLSIIAPNEVIYKDKIVSVTLPGKEGELTVLSGHRPLVTSLKRGKIRVLDSNRKELFFETEGGILEIQNRKVNILFSPDISG